MNQKERIEKALDALVEVGMYLDSISRDDEAVIIINRVSDIRNALTTPQSEASDREVAEKLFRSLNGVGCEDESEEVGIIIDSFVTIRADERWKDADFAKNKIQEWKMIRTVPYISEDELYYAILHRGE
jgi:hypothetical protein